MRFALRVNPVTLDEESIAAFQAALAALLA